MFGIIVGVGAVFASSTRMTTYYTRNASLKWQEWFCLLGAGTIGYQTSRYISIHQFGDVNAWRNHWVAYNYVKSGNRWEGRQILRKAPMNY